MLILSNKRKRFNFSNYYRRSLLFVSYFSISFGMLLSSGFAQDISPMEVSFLNGNEEIINWAIGGMQSPQFNAADVNGDEKMDLIVYDRVGNVILPFINEGDFGEIKYRYDASYKDVFPPIKAWMKLRDFNNDGVMDLFKCPSAAGIPGVEVQKGIRDANERLGFELVEFPNEQFNILFVQVGNGKTQIYNSIVDIPDVIDLDNDGDLDIVSFEPSGFSVTYYKNLSMERYGDSDHLEYELSTNCWGHFREDGFTEEITLSPDCSGCGSNIVGDEVEKRHSGSTLCAFDEDGNGKIDLLLGDLDYSGLVLLNNNGSFTDACMDSQTPRFPGYDTPVDIEIFNSSFYLDVNNDGKRDLLVAPNNQNAQQNINHIWLYLNVGTDANPRFELETRNFLVEESFYFGSYSNVSFTDFNQDGLMDFVLGTSGFFSTGTNKDIRLVRFQNIGSKSIPKYKMIDDDYLGFSEFSTTSVNIAPCFGDLDGDGDEDLLIGDQNGYLYYLQNTAGAGNPYQFAAPIYSYFDIRVGRYVKPSIADVNQDGLGDIILGERNFNRVNNVFGSLNYIQNVGSVGNPSFNPVSSEENSQTWGGIYTKVRGFINNYAAPTVKKVDNDFLLVMGTESGKILAYDNIANNEQGDFDSVEVDFSFIKEGFRVTPDIADIDNDGYFEMIVGNIRSGFAIYNTGLRSSMSSATKDSNIQHLISIYPNPTKDIIYIGYENNASINTIEIIDIYGEVIESYTNNPKDIDVSHLVRGSYLLQFNVKNNRIIKQFIKL